MKITPIITTIEHIVGLLHYETRHEYFVYNTNKIEKLLGILERLIQCAERMEKL